MTSWAILQILVYVIKNIMAGQTPAAVCPRSPPHPAPPLECAPRSMKSTWRAAGEGGGAEDFTEVTASPGPANPERAPKS